MKIVDDTIEKFKELKKIKKNMGRKDRSQRMDFKKKRFGVCKWQYDKLDSIDLLIEVGILSNCKFIDR